MAKYIVEKPGFNCSSTPTYQAETCSPCVRGGLVCLQCTLTIAGLIIAYFLDIRFSYISRPVQWRFPISFHAIFAVFLVLMVWVMPDTPRWLPEKRRVDEVTRVLGPMAGKELERARAYEQRDELPRSLVEEKSAAGPGEFQIKQLFQGGIHGAVGESGTFMRGWIAVDAHWIFISDQRDGDHK
jgi:hypothetical protein